MKQPIKILADENMPLVHSLFSEFGEVTQLSGRNLSRAAVADADVLLVRSVTKVDRQLLDGSNVRFVGSATIGTDHVDLAYLDQQGIRFASAPGCNADAVMNYVVAALSAVDTDWLNKTVGIVGCGNVGRRVYQALKALSVRCVCYDPFLDIDKCPELQAFEEILGADIICVHTPLTDKGSYPTYHMFNAEVLATLKAGTLLLNAGRGPVVDNQALKKELVDRRLKAILDVWENEPDIDEELLALVDIGTPHIAGYSLEGRIRGTAMIYEAFCHWQNHTCDSIDIFQQANRLDNHSVIKERQQFSPRSANVLSAILAAYNPVEDYHHLHLNSRSDAGLGATFDYLRKNYAFRREFAVGELEE